MNNLKNKLQEEIGLTEEQAIKTLSIIKELMDNKDVNFNWGKYFKKKGKDLFIAIKYGFKLFISFCKHSVIRIKRLSVQIKQTTRYLVKMFKEEQ